VSKDGAFVPAWPWAVRGVAWLPAAKQTRQRLNAGSRLRRLILTSAASPFGPVGYWNLDGKKYLGESCPNTYEKKNTFLYFELQLLVVITSTPKYIYL
jgi:hypothetical protein